MKVVIASDKFKGSLSSEQVAAAIEEGILAAMPDCEIDKLHVADGGDGTVCYFRCCGCVFLRPAL